MTNQEGVVAFEALYKHSLPPFLLLRISNNYISGAKPSWLFNLACKLRLVVFKAFWEGNTKNLETCSLWTWVEYYDSFGISCQLQFIAVRMKMRMPMCRIYIPDKKWLLSVLEIRFVRAKGKCVNFRIIRVDDDKTWTTWNERKENSEKICMCLHPSSSGKITVLNNQLLVCVNLR